jgi:dephospho-CoA kinase
MSGKSVVAKILQDTQGYTCVDMGKIAEQVKATMGTEEEPFEGEVPIGDVEKAVVSTIEKC